MQFGTAGLGTGNKADVDRPAAYDAVEKIREAIFGAHMLFITAGMGGGTCAAPVIARGQ